MSSSVERMHEMKMLTERLSLFLASYHSYVVSNKTIITKFNFRQQMKFKYISRYRHRNQCELKEQLSARKHNDTTFFKTGIFLKSKFKISE